MWWFTCGKDSEAICEFEDKEQLVHKGERFKVSDITLQDFFDRLLYAFKPLYTL